MSTITRVIIEAETVSAREFIRAVMGEEGLRAAMQAAARQADSRRGPVRQEPGHQKPASVEPLPSEVRTVGRSPRSTKPIRSTKSTIVPDPDQLQSAPPVRREIPEH